METNPRDYGERCRFDAFCKTVLKHEAIDYIREMKRRASRETSLERLPQTAMDKLCSADSYPSDSYVFSYSFVDTKGAYAAHRMTDQCFGFIRREHFRLCAELGLILGIVDFGVTSCNDQDSVTVHHKRERLCDPAGFTVKGLCRQFHGGAGHFKFPYPVCNTKLSEMCSYLFNSHNILLA